MSCDGIKDPAKRAQQGLSRSCAIPFFLAVDKFKTFSYSNKRIEGGFLARDALQQKPHEFSSGSQRPKLANAAETISVGSAPNIPTTVLWLPLR
jgi:hypothetical protein